MVVRVGREGVRDMPTLALLSCGKSFLRNIQSSWIMSFDIYLPGVLLLWNPFHHYDDPLFQTNLEEIARELVLAQPRAAAVHHTKRF